MTHLQKAPRKPLFTNQKTAEIFIALFIEEHHKKIAKSLFVDGLTNEETAIKNGYSKRQIERIRAELLRIAVKRLVEKQIPKKVNISLKGTTGWNTKCHCPSCRSMISRGRYCSECGQALE